MLDPIRALRIIEGLTLECEDELLSNIYMIAHQAGKPSCADNHPDFETRALEIEKSLVENRTIGPWKRK